MATKAKNREKALAIKDKIREEMLRALIPNGVEPTTDEYTVYRHLNVYFVGGFYIRVEPKEDKNNFFASFGDISAEKLKRIMDIAFESETVDEASIF